MQPVERGREKRIRKRKKSGIIRRSAYASLLKLGV
jgi:hypothetical protein